MAMNKKDCFNIDTRNICLLCLTPTTSDLETATLPRLNNSNKIKQLLRYIKVKPSEFFASSFQSTEKNGGHEVSVDASMCKLCSKVIEEFGKLYESHVLIMVQMDNCITTVSQSIKTGNESSEKTQHFQEQMEPQGFADMINYTVASNLRNIVLEKCVKKLQLYNLEPRETINERISESNQTISGVENSQDVPIPVVESLPESPGTSSNLNRQPSISTDSPSIVSDKEKLTSQGDDKQEKSADGNSQETKGRAAKKVAMVKGRQENAPHSEPSTSRHTQKNNKCYKCVICNAKLCSPFSLNRHLAKFHTRDKIISNEQHQLLENSTDSLQSTNRETSQLVSVEIKREPPTQTGQPDDSENGHSSSSNILNSQSVGAKKITKQLNVKETALNNGAKSNSKNKRATQRVDNGKVCEGKAGKIKIAKNFKCTICKKHFNRKLGFVLHMSKMHKEKYTFRRHQNPKKVVKTSRIVSRGETNRESKKTGNKHVCSTCGKGYSRKDTLIKHMKFYHPYMCAHCATTFAGLQQLQKHELDAHQIPG